ncbi:hypothetical protein [Terriglobus sp.]|uniref:hypothetical protein n=1 Tax=Terriglobus sp. TaxID=1889013 RepID=UPI003B0020DF
MTAEVIETEHGLALLLPEVLGLRADTVDVTGDATHGLFVHTPKLISKEEWAKLLLGPEEDAGIELPDDPPPAPIRLPNL